MNDLSTEILSRQSSLSLIRFETIVVVGVGGIGSWVALNLALSGQVNKLILIDPDIIEESNLNRTPFRICDIGKLKVDALKYLILERRATGEVITHDKKTNEGKTIDFIQKNIEGYSAIVDCRDAIMSDLYNIGGIVDYYKVGYNGLSITIDPCPQQTGVMDSGQTGYTVIPSFIVPSQLAALLVVNELLVEKKLKEFVTFNCVDVLSSIVKARECTCRKKKKKKEII